MDQPNNAKFAFYYMLSLVALIFSAIAVGTVVFQVVNKNIVDAIEPYRGRFDPGALKFAISAMIIAAPIYFIAMRLINQGLFSGQLDKESAVRRWLTYFILFVASVVMIGWLIAALFSFLDGELTAKFLIKALSAVFIAAFVFSYYLYDNKRGEVAGRRDKVIRIYFISSLTIVFAALVTAFFFSETPAQTRARKYDAAVAERLSQIENAVSLYENSNKIFPASLDELVAADLLSAESARQPGEEKIMEYRVKDKDAFELCANFKTSNKLGDEVGNNYLNSQYRHDAGYQCFSRKLTVPSDIPLKIPRPIDRR